MSVPILHYGPSIIDARSPANKYSVKNNVTNSRLLVIVVAPKKEEHNVHSHIPGGGAGFDKHNAEKSFTNIGTVCHRYEFQCQDIENPGGERFSGHHGSGSKCKCEFNSAIFRISKEDHSGLFNYNWAIRLCWICT